MIHPAQYPQRVAELCGRLEFFVTYCKTIIKTTSPEIAVGLISQEIDCLSPRLEEMMTARHCFLSDLRQGLEERKGVDRG